MGCFQPTRSFGIPKCTHPHWHGWQAAPRAPQTRLWRWWRYLQGGLDAITPAVEPLKSAPSRTSRTKTRRDARKKKAAEDKAELTKYRAKTGRNDKKGSTAPGTMEMVLARSSSLGNSVCPRLNAFIAALSAIHLAIPRGAVQTARRKDETTRQRRLVKEIQITTKEPGRPKGEEHQHHQIDPEDLLTRLRTSSTLEEYTARRTFIFVHHFAGPDDPLSKAMVREARARNVRLRVISVEKTAGSGDLLQDQPYTDHLTWGAARPHRRLS